MLAAFFVLVVRPHFVPELTSSVNWAIPSISLSLSAAFTPSLSALLALLVPSPCDDKFPSPPDISTSSTLPASSRPRPRVADQAVSGEGFGVDSPPEVAGADMVLTGAVLSRPAMPRRYGSMFKYISVSSLTHSSPGVMSEA